MHISFLKIWSYMLTTVAFVSMLSIYALAEDTKKKGELPKSGVLSESTSGGYGDRGATFPWGVEDKGPDSEAPIAGSVSKLNAKELVMHVSNSSKDTYSVNLRVVQYSSSGTQLKSDSFSVTLKPGQSNERIVAAAGDVARSKLELVNWKNLSPKKEEVKSAAK